MAHTIELVTEENTIDWFDPTTNQNFRLYVRKDPDAIDPRLDTEGVHPAVHIVCWHPKYNLGDHHSFRDPAAFLTKLAKNFGITPIPTDDDLTDPEGTFFTALQSAVYIEPIWFYEHRHIDIKCLPVNTFDEEHSCFLGYAYISKQDIIEHVNYSNEDNWWCIAQTRLRDAIDTYKNYLTGNAYCYTLYEENPDKTWKEIETAHSFCGNDIIKNGIAAKVGRNLIDAIRENNYSDFPTEKAKTGLPPMTLDKACRLITKYGLHIHAVPDGASILWQVSQNPDDLPDARAYPTLDEAINAFLRKN